MTEKIIRIATRRSPLALWQAEHVAERLQRTFPGCRTELVKMTTQGDKILDAPLAKIGGKGLFVKELEQGMLEGFADIAVHSMKDVPVEFPSGLHLAAILSREDPTDAFVATHYSAFSDLPANARIGTSSLRRQCQIKEIYPQAEIVSLRGNVNTRLSRLDAGEYDAIILATAGLIRLGMAERITQRLETSVSLPAIGQGAIGIECRSDDLEINAMLNVLHDNETGLCVTAERAMNARLHGGCQVPIAGFAKIQGRQLFMRGLVGSPDGSVIYRAEHTVDLDSPQDGLLDHTQDSPFDYAQDRAVDIGNRIAEDLLAQGAGEILQALLFE